MNEKINSIFAFLNNKLNDNDKAVLLFSDDPSSANAKIWAYLTALLKDAYTDYYLKELSEEIDFDFSYGKDELVFEIIDLYKESIREEMEYKKQQWKRYIYIASSWRNDYYSEVVIKLREAGFKVYDFRNPPSGDPGFKWSSVSEDYMEWSPEQYREMLNHPMAERQFHNDIEAMEACDTCVLVLPCGRSAHTEAGWFAGRGCTTIAYIPERQEPELMYKLFDKVVCSMDELIEALK